jgi:hypothetical protein
MRTTYIIIVVIICLCAIVLLLSSDSIEGMCTNSGDVEYIDTLSMTAMCRPNTDKPINKCNNSQVLMSAHHSDTLRCGTITGTAWDPSKCSVDFSDELNYIVKCDNTPYDTTPTDLPNIEYDADGSPSYTLGSGTTPPSDINQNYTDLTTYIKSGPPVATSYAQMEYIPPQNTGYFNPQNQTLISSLTITSNPNKTISVSSNPISRTSDGPMSNGPMSNGPMSNGPMPPNTTSNTSAYEQSANNNNTTTDPRYEYRDTPTMYNFSEKVNGTTPPYKYTNDQPTTEGDPGITTQSGLSHTYSNIPLPYLPAFRAS